MTRSHSPDVVLRAAQRERRRLILVFAVMLALITGLFAAGWGSAWESREAWHEQAMTWQDRYVELYDEFTEVTGEEPNAPDPDTVAKQGPQGERGIPGPVGPAGAAGRDGRTPSAAEIARAVAGYCADGRCVGPAGADSTVPGPTGATGETGAPGPAGADGRGIQSLYCDTTTGRWTVTYTDSTTADAGVCLAAATTDPEEGTE
ncbi:MAG: hypothetical protein QM630_01680 [Microbacterium sp.]